MPHNQSDATEDAQSPMAAPIGQEINISNESVVPTSPSLFEVVKTGDEAAIKAAIINEIKELAKKHKVDEYEIVFLFDDLDSITDFHSDRLYSVLSDRSEVNDILLTVHSRGGKVEPAFLISKTCKKIAHGKFVVAVPRKAKSAATLLALGADEIHMGMMSQLGPIDPQINNLPVLGLANGLTKISQLVSDYPKSAEMWAKYLTDNLSLRHLGYFERLSESATQYAERLLEGKILPSNQTAKSLGDHFVNHYKDHSFLIDIGEARLLLGENTVKSETVEYSFSNDVYQLFDFVGLFLKFLFKKEFYFVGNLSPESMTIREMSDE